MFPAREDDEAARQSRIAAWQNRTPHGNFPPDPRKWEETRCATATLTDLGKKLLGLERW
jgi:hypothetical protein